MSLGIGALKVFGKGPVVILALTPTSKPCWILGCPHNEDKPILARNGCYVDDVLFICKGASANCGLLLCTCSSYERCFVTVVSRWNNFFWRLWCCWPCCFSWLFLCLWLVWEGWPFCCWPFSCFLPFSSCCPLCWQAYSWKWHSNSLLKRYWFRLGVPYFYALSMKDQ